MNLHDNGPAREINVKRANVARVYDYLLGGKDNYQADRDAAAELIRQLPHSTAAARDNRDFLRPVVRDLTAHGIVDAGGSAWLRGCA